MELSQECKWILPIDFHNSHDCCIEYIDSFSITQIDEPIYMRISAFHQCTLWINGRFVFVSPFTNYPGTGFYDTIDISEFVQFGRNTLRIICLYKNNTINADCYGITFDILYADKTILVSSNNTLSRIVTNYKTSTTLAYSYNYSIKNSNDFFNSTSINNKCKLFPRPLDFPTVGKRMSSYIFSMGLYAYNLLEENPTIYEKLTKSFKTNENLNELCNNIPKDNVLVNTNPILVRVSPNKYDNVATGTYCTFDLKTEANGFIELDIAAQKGTRIYITNSSKIKGTASSIARNDIGKFVCDQGRNRFTFFFNNVTCRYITIYIEAFEFDIYYIGLRKTSYPITKKALFKASDLFHNKIFEKSEENLYKMVVKQYNNLFSAEPPIDFLLSNAFSSCVFYVYENDKIIKQLLSLCCDSMDENGYLSGGKFFNGKIIPVLSLIWILKWHEYVFYSGDVFFAREMWPYAEKIIRTFWRNAKGKDIQHPFNDDSFINYYDNINGLNDGFPKELRSKNNINNYDGILTIFYIMALDSVIKVAKYIYSHTDEFQKSIKQFEHIDFVEKISWCELLINSSKSNFHSTFWDDETKAYCTYVVNGDKVYFSELMNSLALYSDLVPLKYKNRIASILSNNEKCFPELISITQNNSLYKYEALLTFDFSYGEYVLNDIVSIWEKSIYDLEDDNDTHQSIAALIIYLKYILGISPKTFGFRDYSFKPLKIKTLLPVSGKIPRPGKPSIDIIINNDNFKVK